MGGGSHRPPRLDKKHLTPRSPRLSGPVPTCRSCGFMRGHKSRGGNIGIPFLWREIQQAARCHNVSTLHISILPSSGIHISIQHQDMVNHMCISHRLTLNSAYIHSALVVLHPEKSLSDTKMAPIPQPGSLEIFDYLWVHVVYTIIMFNFF